MNQEQMIAAIRETLSRFSVNGRPIGGMAAMHLASAISADIIREAERMADERAIEALDLKEFPKGQRLVITICSYADYRKAHDAMSDRKLIDGWEVMRINELGGDRWEVHVDRPDRRAL